MFTVMVLLAKRSRPRSEPLTLAFVAHWMAKAPSRPPNGDLSLGFRFDAVVSNLRVSRVGMTKVLLRVFSLFAFAGHRFFFQGAIGLQLGGDLGLNVPGHREAPFLVTSTSWSLIFSPRIFRL